MTATMPPTTIAATPATNRHSKSNVAPTATTENPAISSTRSIRDGDSGRRAAIRPLHRLHTSAAAGLDAPQDGQMVSSGGASDIRDGARGGRSLMVRFQPISGPG